MKKKVISLLLSMVLLLSLLTGCIHQDMGVKMNRDGTGSITTTLGIKRDFYEQLKDEGSDPFEGKTVTEYQYDGATYVAYAETKNYSSYDAMEKALLDLTYETDMLEDAQNPETEEGENVTVEPVSAATPTQDNHIFSSVNIEKNSGIFYSSYTFNAVLNSQSSEGLDYDLNEIFQVTLTVEMPAEVTGAKGGQIEGKKVIFDIADITAAQELSATCEENNTGLVIGIVVGLVVLAVIAVFLLKQHKK